MKILGIETSCDETAASIVTDKGEILSNVIVSQIFEHQKFGGVVPEIASRAHLLHMQNIIERALQEADTALEELDAIAVTAGPGLIGGLLVGVMFAKGLSFASNKPLLAINHLEGHALTARLTNEVEFPYLMLLVSGGHCQILIVEQVGVYRKLGGTLDDAVGESFDKVAKMLGLDYPGGPIIEKLALKGNPNAYEFPKAMKGREGCDFSFSGLKTAVRLVIEKAELNEQNIADICASFQKTVLEIILDRLNNAIKIAKNFYPQLIPSPTSSLTKAPKELEIGDLLSTPDIPGQATLARDDELSAYSAKKLDIKQLVIAGGVAANQYILENIRINMIEHGLDTIAPPIKLCTDNAAMIAWAGVERFRLGKQDLNIVPRSRWPLDSL